MRRPLQTAGLVGRVIALVLIIATTFSYAMFQGGFVSWFLFYSFLPFAVYSLLLISFPLTSFQVKRTIKQKRFVAGESMTVMITIDRKFPFPLYYLFIEDECSDELRAGDMEAGKTILFPGFKRHITYEYPLHSLSRGKHQFKGIRFKTADFLGLIEKELAIPAEEEILVYPAIKEVRYRQIDNKFAHGTVSARVQHQRDTSMAVGVREYLSGDKFSWINWKATARKNKLMTKEFEQKTTYDVVMFLNRTNGRTNQLAFEKSVSFAASAARAILREDARLGLISIGRDKTVIQMNNGMNQEAAIMYHLAAVKADSSVPFGRVLEQEIRKWPTGISVMIVTHELTRELVHMIEQLAYRNHSILLFYVTNGKQGAKAAMPLVERLAAQQVMVKVIGGDTFEDAFSGVGMR